MQQQCKRVKSNNFFSHRAWLFVTKVIAHIQRIAHLVANLNLIDQRREKARQLSVQKPLDLVIVLYFGA